MRLGWLVLFMATFTTARASTVVLTMTGALSSGTDTSGMWGYIPGAPIPAGTRFTLVFTFNDKLGTGTLFDGSGNSYIETQGTSNPGTATLTINKRSFTFAAPGRANLFSEVV